MGHLDALSKSLSGRRHEDAARIASDPLFRVNAADGGGRTALHCAAYFGSEAVCGILLGRGAKVDAKDNNGASALFDAVAAGKPDVVALLLSHQADAAFGDRHGRTALFRLYNCCAEIGPALIRAGARLDATDQQGRTALAIAAHSGYIEAVKWFLERNSKFAVMADSRGNTPLHLAAAQRLAIGWEMYDPWWVDGVKPPVLLALLAHGADPNARNREGDAPLHLAARWRFRPAIELLRRNGADPRATNGAGERPIDTMDATPRESFQPPDNFDWETTERAIRELLAPL